MNTCKNRVWDNNNLDYGGKMVYCGKPAGSHEYCPECYEDVHKQLIAKMIQYSKELYFTSKELTELELCILLESNKKDDK